MNEKALETLLNGPFALALAGLSVLGAAWVLRILFTRLLNENDSLKADVGVLHQKVELINGENRIKTENRLAESTRAQEQMAAAVNNVASAMEHSNAVMNRLETKVDLITTKPCSWTEDQRRRVTEAKSVGDLRQVLHDIDDENKKA